MRLLAFVAGYIVTLTIVGSVIATTSDSNVALNDYSVAINASSGNAVVLLVQDGCTPCRRLENDIVPILRQAGIMQDSSIHIISINKQPDVVKRLQGSGLNSRRGFPVVLAYRNKGGREYGWRYIGYGDKVTMVNWFAGVKKWQPKGK